MDIELEKLKKLEHALCDAIDILRGWQVEEVMPEEVKPERKVIVAKRCSNCVHEHCSATKEPCVSCKPEDSKYEVKEEMKDKDKMNPIQEKKMRRYNLKVKDWDELKEMAVKMFKGIAALNERFAEKISEGEFVTQDDWKMMNGLWRTFNYTNDNNQLCKDDLHHLFTEDNLDEEFVEIKAEEAKDKKKLRPYINSAEMIADFIARFKVDCPPYCEPLIWVKTKSGDAWFLMTGFGKKVSVDGVGYSLDELLKYYVYLDGSPVGMEVKE